MGKLTGRTVRLVLDTDEGERRVTGEVLPSAVAGFIALDAGGDRVVLYNLKYVIRMVLGQRSLTESLSNKLRDAEVDRA